MSMPTPLPAVIHHLPSVRERLVRVERGVRMRPHPVPLLVSIAAILTFWGGQTPGPLLRTVTAQTADRTDAVRQAVVGGAARNVILFLGDGLGDSEITLARNYAVGASGRLALDTLPLTGAYTTYSLQERDPTLPDYVPDSAATGTAWATGSKTSNGRISTTAGTDRDLRTILEIAQERGMRTGDVTTAELTDATPAVLAAHVRSRTCQGPADMAECPQDRKTAGGPGSIAEQLIAHRVDVLMGGGAARFEQQPMDCAGTSGRERRWRHRSNGSVPADAPGHRGDTDHAAASMRWPRHTLLSVARAHAHL
jgi:alkaline phosphatase